MLFLVRVNPAFSVPKVTAIQLGGGVRVTFASGKDVSVGVSGSSFQVPSLSAVGILVLLAVVSFGVVRRFRNA